MNPTTTAEKTLILEVITTRTQTTEVGMRIYADGRYEYLSDIQIDIAADGSSTTRSVPHAWRLVRTYTANQIANLREAIRAADIAALPARSVPDGTTHDGSTQTWRIWQDGKETTIVIEGYPLHALPALNILLQNINELQPLKPSRSEWRVWVAGTIEQRDIHCDISSVQQLRGLVQALLAPAAAAANATPINSADLPDVPADTPLVEVLWQEPGRPDERTLAYIDGRVLSIVDGKTTLLHTLNGTQLAELLRAGAQIDWVALPDPVC